ncbi:hypothetical protein HGRIS_012259 [Hohenbuehelia grisea]|uniref:DUF7587 domain-containing protein n=1 Tax=Hohenbuehelia grisea TaxID=104357 RepID=A0ABR3IRQ7_9AGAR
MADAAPATRTMSVSEPNLDGSHVQTERTFLFRIYTPKKTAKSAEADGPYFVGPLFDGDFSSSPASLSEGQLPFQSKNSTYDDAVRHLDWTTRSSSPFISASFSFVWSLWEALRRYRMNIKHDIHIAVIDATGISDRYVATLDLLKRGIEGQLHRNHSQWTNFARESQSVLVYGTIPKSAVYTSIPLLSLLDKLPSYLLHSDASPIEKPLGSIGRVAWDSSQRKTSFKRFTQDIFGRFRRLPLESRLRDTTAGSVRLAIAFLQPWFHTVVRSDFNQAVDVTSRLALDISQWPSHWWPQEHQTKIESIVKAMAVVVAEEVRDSGTRANVVDFAMLRAAVDGLSRAAERQRPLLAHHPLAVSPSPIHLHSAQSNEHTTRGHEETEIQKDMLESGVTTTDELPSVDVRDVVGGISVTRPDATHPADCAPPAEALSIQILPASDLINLDEVYPSPTLSIADLLLPVQESLAVAHDGAAVLDPLLCPDLLHMPISAAIVPLEAPLTFFARDDAVSLHESDSSDSASEPASPMLSRRHLQEYTDTEATDTDCGEMDWEVLGAEEYPSLDPPVVETAKSETEQNVHDAETTPTRGSDEVNANDRATVHDAVSISSTGDCTPIDDRTPTAETIRGVWYDVRATTTANVKPTRDTPAEHHPRDRASASETASYVLTCFLIGSFIALCVLSPHRRSITHQFT